MQLNRSLTRFSKQRSDFILSVPPPHRLQQEAARIAVLFEQGAHERPWMVDGKGDNHPFCNSESTRWHVCAGVRLACPHGTGC